MPLFLTCLISAIAFGFTAYLFDRRLLKVARQEFDFAFPNVDDRVKELNRLKNAAKRIGFSKNKTAENIALDIWIRNLIR